MDPRRLRGYNFQSWATLRRGDIIENVIFTFFIQTSAGHISIKFEASTNSEYSFLSNILHSDYIGVFSFIVGHREGTETENFRFNYHIRSKYSYYMYCSMVVLLVGLGGGIKNKNKARARDSPSPP